MLSPSVLSLLYLKLHGYAYFIRKNDILRDLLKDALLILINREEKSPAPGGILAHNLSNMRHLPLLTYSGS